MLNRRRSVLLIVAVASAIAIVFGVSYVAAGPTSRVSLTTGSAPTNGPSYTPSASATGRYVDFASDATNLTATATNGVTQVYVRDRDADAATTDTVLDFDDAASSDGDNDPAAGVATSIVSLDSTSNAAQASATQPAISANGRYVAFVSRANNLPNANGSAQVYVRDRTANTTTLVSTGASGAGNADSFAPAIGWDGRFVAFASYATNLTAAATNGVSQVYVRDTTSGGGVTVLVSVNASGAAGGDGASTSPSISWNGGAIAYASQADNLVSGDTNGVADVFLRNRDSDGDGDYDDEGTAGDTDNDPASVATTRVSVSSAGLQASADSAAPAISPDGSAVAFSSAATNLVSSPALNGPAQVFERIGAATALVSVDSNGTQGNGPSASPSLSFDGRFAAFQSLATNLLTGGTLGGQTQYVGGSPDTNGAWDIFVHDRLAAPLSVVNPPGAYGTYRVSVNSSGVQANADSITPSLCADGRFVAFSSSATNLAAPDTNNADDIFVKDADTDGDGYTDTLETAIGRSPTTACAIMRADVDGDGTVTIVDLSLVSSDNLMFVPPANPRFDQNGDGQINVVDYSIQAGYFLNTVSQCSP